MKTKNRKRPSAPAAGSRPTIIPGHRKWRQFCRRLSGPEGCDFGRNGGGWKCNNRGNRPFARKILKAMGANVEASLRYFDANGGHCDCEILFNVDR